MSWPLLLLALGACQASTTAVTPAQPPTVAAELLPIPTLPEGILLQVFFRDSGLTWRVADDGRWLVTQPGGVEQQLRPMARLRRGAELISAGGLDRLRAALDAVSFATLPPSVQGGLPSGATLPNGREYRQRPIAFVARVDGATHTVQVAGDPRAPGTLGVLGALYQQLDQEAIGDWAAE